MPEFLFTGVFLFSKYNHWYDYSMYNNYAALLRTFVVVYVFCAASGTLVKGVDNNIEHFTAQVAGFFALAQQHGKVKKRAEIKKTKSGCFGRLINEVTKLQLKFFQLLTLT